MHRYSNFKSLKIIITKKKKRIVLIIVRPTGDVRRTDTVVGTTQYNAFLMFLLFRIDRKRFYGVGNTTAIEIKKKLTTVIYKIYYIRFFFFFLSNHRHIIIIILLRIGISLRGIN